MATLTVKPEELMTAANQIATEAGTLEEKCKALDSKIETLTTNAKGMASNAFYNRYVEMQDAIHGFPKIVQAIADTAPAVIVDKVEAGSCKAVSDVEITPYPVFPQTKKYVLLAAVGGICAACGVLVLNHLLHNYVVDGEDVQQKLDLPVLGLIPEV